MEVELGRAKGPATPVSQAKHRGISLRWSDRWAPRIGRYLYKSVRFASFPLLFPLALLLRIVLQLLKPIMHIRFGRLWSPRLGTFSFSLELYLCEKEAGVEPGHAVDIFYHYDRDGYMLRNPVKPKDAVCNQQLDVMWRRTLHVHEFARALYSLNVLLPRGSEDFIAARAPMYDRHGLLKRFPPHLSFTEAEEERGFRGLLEMGLRPGAPFVCFHARDSAYLDRSRPRKVELYGDWSHQDLRDATIDNYIPAVTRLVDLGYYAIRMGKFVKYPLRCDDARVIDYASRFQSDFMDVYLAAKCSFFIGQNSGMTALPMTFRRPLVYVNVFPLSEIVYCSYDDGIFIPKVFYSSKKHRLLTFREILDLGIGHFNIKNPRHVEVSRELGLEVRENSPEEITEAALEMHLRLHSEFSLSEEDQELQGLFSSIVRTYPDVIPLENNRTATLGRHFLRRHRELLQ